MGNRKLPFGYTMQLGEIVLHPEESPYVRMIFEQYLQGASFIDLAEMMQYRGVPYSEEKSWNKNVIARLLENNRYTGQSSYPMIISQEQFDAVAAIRATKQVVTEKITAQKFLRKLCDSVTTPDIEQQVLYLLNMLVKQPELVHTPTVESKVNPEITIIRERLDKILAQQPIDEALARQLIYELVAAEYDAIDSLGYETERIRGLLLASEPADELNEVLLQNCIEKVMTANGTICLRLRNGQIIERSTLP